MNISKDRDGYFVVSSDQSSNPAISPELSNISTLDFSTISTDNQEEAANHFSPISISNPFSQLPQVLVATFENIFPAAFRHLFGRYVFWPFVSGITSAFTQELFRFGRRRRI
jgi:hypothetical protein